MMGHYKGERHWTHLERGMWVRFNESCKLRRRNIDNQKVERNDIAQVISIDSAMVGGDLVIIKLLDGRKLAEDKHRLSHLVTELHPLEVLALQAED